MRRVERMGSWLHHLMARVWRPAGTSTTALASYPPYRAPHVGPPFGWTRAQAEENLEHLLHLRSERLVLLGSWLRTHAGIDIRPALLGGDLPPLLDILHAWARDAWPAWHRPALATPEAWLHSRREGEDVVFSLLFDVALLLGELILVRHDGYRWALDLDPLNERDRMPSWQRPVLKLPKRGAMPADIDIDIDLEDIVVARYQHPDDVMPQLFNPWTRTVMPAVTRANEAAWTAPRAAP